MIRGHAATYFFVHVSIFVPLIKGYQIHFVSSVQSDGEIQILIIVFHGITIQMHMVRADWYATENVFLNCVKYLVQKCRCP